MAKQQSKARKLVARPKQAVAAAGASSGGDTPGLYTLEVFLLSGPLTARFSKQNPEISRMIQMRGDQTLQDLHDAIFDAFGRSEQHFYEFQFGKGPMDPKGLRYVLPEDSETQSGEGNAPAGRVDQTTLASLDLKVGVAFGYWFDFGDDWWHQINVESVDEGLPRGTYPKVISQVGKNPPQHAERDEEEGKD